MRRATRNITVLDANNASLATYSNLKFTIDGESYNISNDMIIFNSLNDSYTFVANYYGT